MTYPRKTLIMQNFFFVLKPGMAFFRLFGWGFQWMTYADYKPYFSERYGYCLPIVKTQKWRIFLLKPIKKKKTTQRPAQFFLLQGGKK